MNRFLKILATLILLVVATLPTKAQISEERKAEIYTASQSHKHGGEHTKECGNWWRNKKVSLSDSDIEYISTLPTKEAQIRALTKLKAIRTTQCHAFSLTPRATVMKSGSNILYGGELQGAYSAHWMTYAAIFGYGQQALLDNVFDGYSTQLVALVNFNQHNPSAFKFRVGGGLSYRWFSNDFGIQVNEEQTLYGNQHSNALGPTIMGEMNVRIANKVNLNFGGRVIWDTVDILNSSIQRCDYGAFIGMSFIL
ncbi:MAG: hypothetical protein R3Y43_07725 [Alphaproteobacteria bacterium]